MFYLCAICDFFFFFSTQQETRTQTHKINPKLNETKLKKQNKTEKK